MSSHSAILRQHAIDLRLLEHHFGHEDVVRIVGLPPGQIASVAPVPLEEPPAESLSVRSAGAGNGRQDHSTRRGTSELPYNRHRVKIYTKTGDAGETGLFDGTRVPKADPRVATYGDVDELNAWLGLARPHRLGHRARRDARAIQRDLFAVGARLADPAHRIAARVTKAGVSTTT